ncbi:MAG TPA: hypothetical protein VKG65_12100 [Terriglobales bacterium]|nr:hypothetical protein [Terriglobales bacterium]
MDDLIYSRLAASGYCIKPGYQFRDKPEGLDEAPGVPDATVQQPDVYRLIRADYGEKVRSFNLLNGGTNSREQDLSGIGAERG